MNDPNAPSVLLAFAAGFVSFLSPCVLPLVPGYLSTVCGVAPSELRHPHGATLRQVLLRGGLFALTFTLIFVLLGMTATGVGNLLTENQHTLERIAGVAIVIMGVLFLASLLLPVLNREWRPAALVEWASGGSPLLAGAAFAIAWTPCASPALASILGLASTQSTVAHGGFLLAIYSAGLAVPFLLTAVAFNRATTAFSWLKRHYAVVNGVAGLVLVTLGVLVFSGELFRLNIEVQRVLDDWNLDFFKNV
jgi:cytochrome c-type biogenesis protein